jgi:hypothetical protein
MHSNNDLMDPNWKPDLEDDEDDPEPVLFIEKKVYDKLLLENLQIEKKLYALQFEIDTRWEPALKKSRRETAAMQHDMMERHELYVTAETQLRDLLAQVDAGVRVFGHMDDSCVGGGWQDFSTNDFAGKRYEGILIKIKAKEIENG